MTLNRGMQGLTDSPATSARYRSAPLLADQKFDQAEHVLGQQAS